MITASTVSVLVNRGISRVFLSAIEQPWYWVKGLPGNEQHFILLMQVTRSGPKQKGNALALTSISRLPALPPRPKRCPADAALSFILASIYEARTLSTRSVHATSGSLDIARSSCHCVYLPQIAALPECV